MNEFNFEEFNQKQGRFTPYISIAKTGGFGISSGFNHKYKVDEAIGVKLYWDQNNKAIGMRFLSQEESAMFKIKLRKDGGGFLPAKSFFGSYDIDTEKYTGRYEPKVVNDTPFGKMFVIELRKESNKFTDENTMKNQT